MSSQNVPIHRTNTDGNSKTKENDVWFNAFDFAPGQDSNIRWLSRPNQQGKYSSDTEKFRITFDVENFKSEQIKIYVQNRQLTISGVYEEHSEGRFMQKQFERTFDIPANADVNAMASFITPNHMLVVEIPLGAATPAAAQADHLSIDQNANNQRRLSFSLNKFNDLNKNQQSSLTTSNDLAAPGQSVRRTSITKTTTTTTTTGSSALPSEATELLKNTNTTTNNTSQTYTKQTNESNASTNNKQTILTSSDLANLPIDIPSELLTSGGTITIQKRKVSISRGTDGNPDQNASTSATQSTNNTDSKTSSTTTTQNTHQTGSVPITRSDNQSTTTNTQSKTSSNQEQSSTNQHRMYTFEEFLQNTTWNPSVSDGANGKKILHMRLQMKSGTKSEQIKISLNGHDLRVEVDNKLASEGSRQISGHSYRQVTLFPTCDVNQLKTELKDDGFLHIQVPIIL